MRKSVESHKQSNNLFNYFTKTDKKDENNCLKSKTNGSAAEDKKTDTIGANNASVSQPSAQSSATGVESIGYVLYDLVWAKLEGYPWWPSIVCLHPTVGTITKRKGKTMFIHVMFFDDPPSRAWIRLRDVKTYLGKHKSDVPLLKDQKWNQAIEFADQALNMPSDQRWALIPDLKPSDDEMDDQLIDDLDFGATDVLNKSNEDKSSVKESPKTKSNKSEEKSEQKSELKRKVSQRESTGRKKLKRVALESSGDEDIGSDDEFKVGSDDETSDEEVDKEVDNVSDELGSDLDFDSSDSEPKHKRKKSSKSDKKSKKSSKKSKHRNKSKKISKKSHKKSKKSSSDSDLISLDSDFDSSDSETNRMKSKPLKTPPKSKEPELSVDSDSDSKDSKPMANSSKSDNTSKNWLTERINSSAKKSNVKKSSDVSKGSNKQMNKSIASVADESFISVYDSSDQKGDQEWPHLKHDFLKPNKIQDKSGKFRLIGADLNPDYDPTTLLIPEDFLDACTPAIRQWWMFKADHFDTVLFFKMGKFYELFNMDAVIAVSELQIAYMKGDGAHAGFPEKSYKRYADVLIQKGYKVARIEQTETPQMMEERVKKLYKPTKFDKVVKRELCRVSSIGTRMASVIDADMLSDGNSNLYAINENATENGVQFGVCFIDVSIGKFYLSQFSDDTYCSRLQTLLAHNPPVELIFDRKSISPKTKHFIENSSPNVRKEVKKVFWTSNKTLKYLTESDVFNGGLPEVLANMLDKNDSLQQTALPEYELAFRSLGAVIEYCSECLIEDEVLSMKLFEEYKHFDGKGVNTGVDVLPKHMILDSYSARNLEIFRNSLGGTEGTLNEVLDYCSTPFGRRLLHKWICSPICDIKQIVDRQSAIKDLTNSSIRYEIEETIKLLKRLPDLERLITKIHSQGSAKRAESHPDARAILFENDIYSKRKILDFLSVLDGFKQLVQIVESFEKHIQLFESSLLTKCLSSVTNGGHFPDLSGSLRYFDNAFDHKKAKQEGKVFPHSGADVDYDALNEDIKSIEQKFEDYLSEQRKFFGCKVTYFGNGKNRYQLEVPESATKKIANNDNYKIESSRKGYKRYSTPYIGNLFEKLVTKEEKKESVLKDVMRRIFETFDKKYDKWLEAIECLSLFDVLLSLSKSRSFLQQNGSVVCLPKFVDSNKPFIHLKESRNPCLLKYCQNFIPNDIRIEGELLLLTGPNMGGKSTLMRQLGLIVIMAQLGTYVPALECTLTPVDRIFTRIGAFDRIIDGESTFFVELSETSMVLRNATKHSLVLIDELGRGTSTYDGAAIASAVTKELSERIKCRTLFSSHYHLLVDEFKDNPFVKLVHMACMVENENETDPTEESITFLYKLRSNACPKSYGFNAAQLAGIPKQVIRNAFKRAQEFERQNQIKKIFIKVIENTVNDNEIQSIVPILKSFSLNNN